MEKPDINALKQRLLNRLSNPSSSKPRSSNKNLNLVTYVTKTKKVTKPKERKETKSKRKTAPDISFAINNNIQTFLSPLLNLVVEYVSRNIALTCRSLLNGTMEQIDVTRVKPDFVDNNNVPVTAARLLIRDDGLVQFSVITGKVEETQIDINENLSPEIETHLQKLDETYCFCYGLPTTLAEIRCYPHSFQFSQDSPYNHVRSKDCLLWYQQSNRITIRERNGVEKVRCPPCKRYFCKIAKWCRQNLTNDESVKKKTSALRAETLHLTSKKANATTTAQNVRLKITTATLHGVETGKCKQTSEKLFSEIKDLLSSNNNINEDKTVKNGTTKRKMSTISTSSTFSKKVYKSTFEKSTQTSFNKRLDTQSATSLIESTSEIEQILGFSSIQSSEAALLASACSIQALYDSSDDVVELTGGNFNHKVINGDEIWIVEFYAPWCGHCKSLAPEWKKAATALKGIVKVGAVDMDVHGSVGGPYNVRGFPTLKVFGSNKNSPQDYNGARTAQAIVDEAMKVAQRVAKDRLNGGGSNRGSGGSGGSGDSGDDVVELTDANFEKEVFGSKLPVLVEFFAPWCGHCQRLAPEWKKAASELKGKVILGALDATVHTNIAGRFQVQGYPTIKVFRAGVKDFGSAEDFQGGRTASDIIAYALDLHAAAVEPPELLELTSNSVLADNCNEKPLCVVSFLPDILDTQAEGRNNYLKVLRELGEKYKAKLWGWVWTASATHGKLEQALGVGGFGYPALAVVNIRKKVFVGLRGSFAYDGIDELLKSIAVGRGRTERLTNGLPTISDVPAWDGLDGKLPDEEDIDLSDIELEDLDTDKKIEL